MANVITLDVYQIGNFPVKQGNTASISIDFPAALIFAQETSIIVSGVQMNAFIVFNGQQYYVAETVAQIETAANAGGGGGPTIYTGDGSLPEDRTVDLGGHTLLFKQGTGGLWIKPQNVGINAPSLESFSVYDGNDTRNLVFSVNGNAGVVSMGDLSDTRNGTAFQVSDFTQSLSYFNDISGLVCLSLDLRGNRYKIGASVAGNNTLMDIDDTARTITISEVNGLFIPELAGGGTRALSVDNNGRIIPS